MTRITVIKMLYGSKALKMNMVLDKGEESLTAWMVEGINEVSELEATFTDQEIEHLYDYECLP